MIKLNNNKFKIHRLLRALFGLETTRLDLLAIVISALSFAALTLILNSNSDALDTKTIVLIILALDIGGGAVANFTTGTNNYYAESFQKRYLFVVFHLLQPSILIWIFPSELLAILGVSLFTLTSSIIVLNIKKQYNQRIVAITLLLLSLILSTLLSYTDQLIQIIMHFFSLKLILAFSVNWTTDYKDETRI
jgi:membrane glycosyltransferase